MVVSGQFHGPAALSPGKNVGIHSIAGWMGPRAGLDGFGEEKMLLPLPGFEPRTVQPIGNRYIDTDKQKISVSDLLAFVIELLVRPWFDVVQLTHKQTAKLNGRSVSCSRFASSLPWLICSSDMEHGLASFALLLPITSVLGGTTKCPIRELTVWKM